MVVVVVGGGRGLRDRCSMLSRTLDRNKVLPWEMRAFIQLQVYVVRTALRWPHILPPVSVVRPVVILTPLGPVWGPFRGPRQRAPSPFAPVPFLWGSIRHSHGSKLHEMVLQRTGYPIFLLALAFAFVSASNMSRHFLPLARLPPASPR